MIVLSVIQAGAPYGYAIIKEISQRSQGVLNLPEGTIYPILHRLENSGHIASAWEVAPSGRSRRTYHLTESGKKNLIERCDQWNTFTTAINALLLRPKTTTA